MGWVCIALRAYRVKAVFDVYDEYLKMLTNQENLEGEDSILLTNHEELLPGEHTGNRANLSKLSFLKESQLLRKTGFYFLLPSLLLGVLALASPLIYMIVPVYETYQCYEYYNLDSTKCYILEANLCIFYFINWSQTLILVLLLYKIRNVKDELNL